MRPAISSTFNRKKSVATIILMEMEAIFHMKYFMESSLGEAGNKKTGQRSKQVKQRSHPTVKEGVGGWGGERAY